MIRIRSIAAQYAREFARSASVAKGVGEGRGPHVVVRALTDSSHLVPAAAPLESTKQLQRAHHVAAPDSAKLEPQHARAVAEDALKDNRKGHAGNGKRPKQWDGQKWTPEAELVSKLKKMRTIKGPGHLPLAMKILDKARTEGTKAIVAYNVIIKMLGLEQWMLKDKTDFLEELLGKLKEDGLEPNIYTYNGIIFVYAQARSAAKALRAYEEMLSKGIEPNALTLSNVIMAQSWGSLADMYRTLDEMDSKGWVPTRGAHLCLLAAMWQRKDTDGVVKIMGRMLEEDYQPTEAAFAIALMASGRLGKADFAKTLFAKRTAAGLEPKEEIYSSMMLAHAKADLYEESLDYWRQLVCVDGIGEVKIHIETYHCALKSAVVVCQWDEVEAILDMMKSQGVLPQEQTYKTAIAGCRIRKGVDGPEYLERLERAVEAIGRRGIDPTKDVKMRMAVACVHAKMWDKAAALFESSMAQNCEMWPFAWECVIRTFSSLGRFGDVKEVWMLGKTEGNQHTARGNELAMTSAQRLVDADWAMEILSLANAKKKCSATTHAIAVQVLAESGRLREASALLKELRASGAVRLNHKKLNKLLGFCEHHGNTAVGLEFLKEMHSQTPPHRLQPPTLAFVIAALVKHGRAGEVVPLFEEQLAASYIPEKACYEHVARAAFEAGDTLSSDRYTGVAEKLGQAEDEGGEGVFADARRWGSDRGDAMAQRPPLPPSPPPPLAGEKVVAEAGAEEGEDSSPSLRHGMVDAEESDGDGAEAAISSNGVR